MAHIKFVCDSPYICISDDTGNIVTGSAEALMSHPAMVASNKDPNDPMLSEIQLSIIGKYEIVESDPPPTCERINFVAP